MGCVGEQGSGKINTARVSGVHLLVTMISTHAPYIKVSICYTAPNTHTGDEIHVNESSNVRSHVLFLASFPDSHGLKKSMFLPAK